MEARDETLIKSLLDKDEDLRRHWTEHIEFERRLEELNRRVYLTPAEEMERKRLQKLKLAGRDRMEQILTRYRSATA